ncbi:hypothetical protein PAHAL_5G513500 [Panicum hallii]|uniref:Uncharacterized protein n=1 Tax=Panicum hallii TaxID=206008 RepID=A0A2S3HYQ8_9POAL|nr:uncharacterized protein LOC112894439 [Panicum hallii]PAN32801.1 hypothetical protein PAHAL_5G513500 [Panicum hallii]
MAAGFSIRRCAERLRGTAAAELGPLELAARDLPPMEVRVFRWWEEELAAIKAAAAAEEGEGPVAEVDEDEEEAPGNGRTPKKRSITDLFAAAPAVNAVGGPVAAEDDEEVLRAFYRRTKEMRRKRRLEEAAADEPESSAAAEGNFARKKSLDKTNLGDGMDTPDASEEHDDEHNLSTERENIPDLKKRKHGRLNNSLQKKKANRLKYIGSTKAIKVGKRDIKKLPLHSILKKYTKHTSVKMVKEKHGNSKGPGVIELCRKSVKRVKFSEASDALGSKKQCSKRPELANICKLISDAMTSSSSSSLEISSEEEHIIAETSSSRMPEKAFAMAKDANDNTNRDNQSELSSTGLSTGLFDLNKGFEDLTDLNSPYIPNSEESCLQHTQVGTQYMDQQVIDNGRTNHKHSSFNPHGQEQEHHATDLDNRMKSPCTLRNQTIQDSVQLQNWCSMTMHHGVSQLSTGGESSSFQFRGCNLSHSEKQIFHSEMNMQQESRPSAGQTLRLMGHDLTISNTRVDYLSEAAQKQTNPAEDHLTTKLVLELPRQGQPFLSLQTQSTPNISASSASTVAHISASSGSTAEAHFRYRTPHNVRHPLPDANVFSGDPSRCEERWTDFTNLQSHRNVLLGYPPVSNHGSAASIQNPPPPRRYYTDHSTKKDSPSAPFSPINMQHVTPSSDYGANLPVSYGLYSASSSVHPHNSVSFTWSHPDQIVRGVPDSRTSAALPSRNAGIGTARADPDNSTSSSSRFVLRSGPVKLSPGAKHILIPSENTEDDNSAPIYSCVSFGTYNGNVSAPPQNKGAGSRRF